jgi:hypothetical protein
MFVRWLVGGSVIEVRRESNCNGRSRSLRDDKQERQQQRRQQEQQQQAVEDWRHTLGVCYGDVSVYQGC